MCVRCNDKGDTRNYEVEEGRTTWTRQQDLRIRLQQKHEQLVTMQTVLHKMQHGSHTGAMELLARLRTEENVEGLTKIQQKYSSRCVCNSHNIYASRL